MKPMADDQLTKLLSYLQGEFADIRKQIETTDNRLSERLDTLYNYIDEDMGGRDTQGPGKVVNPAADLAQRASGVRRSTWPWVTLARSRRAWTPSSRLFACCR